MNTGTYIRKFFMFFTANIDLSKIIGLMISALMAELINTLPLIIALVILMLIDLRFGVKKWIKKEQKAGRKVNRFFILNFNSDGMRKTLSKGTDYFWMIICAVVFEILVLQHLDIKIQWRNLNIPSLMIAIMCFVEIWSIGENYKELRGYNIVTYIISVLKGKRP